MRGALVAAAAFAAVALTAAAPAAAAPPINTCDEANGQFAQRDLRIGTVAALRGSEPYADPGFFATRRQFSSGRRYWAKTPISVRRGKFVTVGIARRDREIAHIVTGGREADALRYSACPGRRERGEHGWTSWAGGFRLKRAACVHLVARERGSRRVHRATVSFGMGDTCG